MTEDILTQNSTEVISTMSTEMVACKEQFDTLYYSHEDELLNLDVDIRKTNRNVYGGMAVLLSGKPNVGKTQLVKSLDKTIYFVTDRNGYINIDMGKKPVVQSGSWVTFKKNILRFCNKAIAYHTKYEDEAKRTKAITPYKEEDPKKEQMFLNIQNIVIDTLTSAYLSCQRFIEGRDPEPYYVIVSEVNNNTQQQKLVPLDGFQDSHERKVRYREALSLAAINNDTLKKSKADYNDAKINKLVLDEFDEVVQKLKQVLLVKDDKDNYKYGLFITAHVSEKEDKNNKLQATTAVPAFVKEHLYNQLLSNRFFLELGKKNERYILFNNDGGHNECGGRMTHCLPDRIPLSAKYFEKAMKLLLLENNKPIISEWDEDTIEDIEYEKKLSLALQNNKK